MKGKNFKYVLYLLIFVTLEACKDFILEVLNLCVDLKSVAVATFGGGVLMRKGEGSEAELKRSWHANVLGCPLVNT